MSASPEEIERLSAKIESISDLITERLKGLPPMSQESSNLKTAQLEVDNDLKSLTLASPGEENLIYEKLKLQYDNNKHPNKTTNEILKTVNPDVPVDVNDYLDAMDFAEVEEGEQEEEQEPEVENEEEVDSLINELKSISSRGTQQPIRKSNPKPNESEAKEKEGEQKVTVKASIKEVEALVDKVQMVYAKLEAQLQKEELDSPEEPKIKEAVGEVDGDMGRLLENEQKYYAEYRKKYDNGNHSNAYLNAAIDSLHPVVPREIFSDLQDMLSKPEDLKVKLEVSKPALGEYILSDQEEKIEQSNVSPEEKALLAKMNKVYTTLEAEFNQVEPKSLDADEINDAAAEVDEDIMQFIEDAKGLYSKYQEKYDSVNHDNTYLNDAIKSLPPLVTPRKPEVSAVKQAEDNPELESGIEEGKQEAEEVSVRGSNPEPIQTPKSNDGEAKENEAEEEEKVETVVEPSSGELQAVLNKMKKAYQILTKQANQAEHESLAQSQIVEALDEVDADMGNFYDDEIGLYSKYQEKYDSVNHDNTYLNDAIKSLPPLVTPRKPEVSAVKQAEDNPELESGIEEGKQEAEEVSVRGSNPEPIQTPKSNDGEARINRVAMSDEVLMDLEDLLSVEPEDLVDRQAEDDPELERRIFGEEQQQEQKQEQEQEQEQEQKQEQEQEQEQKQESGQPRAETVDVGSRVPQQENKNILQKIGNYISDKFKALGNKIQKALGMERKGLETSNQKAGERQSQQPQPKTESHAHDSTQPSNTKGAKAWRASSQPQATTQLSQSRTNATVLANTDFTAKSRPSINKTNAPGSTPTPTPEITMGMGGRK